MITMLIVIKKYNKVECDNNKDSNEKEANSKKVLECNIKYYKEYQNT